MNDTITCPHCKKDFPASQVFTHHMEQERQKVDAERQKLRADAAKWREDTEKDLQKKAQELSQKKLVDLRKKVEEETSLKLKDVQNESQELKDQNKAQQEQLLELNKLMRQMRADQQKREVENQKKLAEEEQKIREQAGQEAKKAAKEESHFRILELEKRISDVSKVKEDLQRKLEQGSQQMQGEVLELEFEESLKQTFAHDEIKPVPKGIRGADVLQVVKNKLGMSCGTILWEFKRTKAWSGEWVSKLKEDQRAVSADVAIIVSTVVPDTITLLGEIDGVMIAQYQTALGLAHLARTKLIEAQVLKQASVNADEKKDIVYEYVRSREFRHRMEAIAEGYKQHQDELEREKRWYAQKWARQEKIIRKMTDNTFAMMGEIEGIMGQELEYKQHDAIEESTSAPKVDEGLFEQVP